MKHTISALVALSLAALAEAAEQEITLEQALHYSLKQNRDLIAARMDMESRRLDIEDAESEFKLSFTPSISADASDGQTGYGAGLAVSRKFTAGTEVGLTGDSGVTVYEESGTNYYRHAVQVQISQPLLKSAGPLVNKEGITASENRLTAGRREIELKKCDLIVNVVGLYEALLQLQTGIELQQRTVARLERLLRLTRSKEQQGRATRSDTIRAEIKSGDAQLQLARNHEQLARTKTDFAGALGFPPDTGFKAAPAGFPQIATGGVQTAVSVALSNRLDYAQILQDSEDAKRGALIARRNLLPRLDLTAGYRKSGESEDAGEASRLGTDIWFVGLSGSEDLAQRPERNNARRTAIAVDMAQVRVEAVRDAVAGQVMQAYAAHETARSAVSVAKKNHELAMKRVEVARRMFERGRSDGFHAAEAEDELQSAQAKWLSAQTDAAVSAYKLLRATGTLIEHPTDLKPGWRGSVKMDEGKN